MAQRVVTVGSMRIELPLPAWADAAQRAEDDAHTLTVAAERPADWVTWQWPLEPGAGLRCEVPAAGERSLTLTL